MLEHFPAADLQAKGMKYLKHRYSISANLITPAESRGSRATEIRDMLGTCG
jgi:hypothetical protein